MSDGVSVVESWRDACSAAGGVEDRGGGAREPAEAAMEREWVHALLAHLGEDLCLTLLLREVVGLRYAEIARQLGLPIGTDLSPAADGKPGPPARRRPISVGAR